MEIEHLLEQEKKYRPYWIGCLLFLFSIGFFVVNSHSKKEARSTSDYKTIEKLFEKFTDGEPLSSEAIQSAVAILKRHPELHPTYDSLLSFAFAHQNNTAESIAYAKLAMRRAEQLFLTPYCAFGEISLLVSKNNLAEAFHYSKLLEETLKSNKSSSVEKLRVFNLIRMSLLAKELGNVDDKTQAWTTATSLKDFSTIAALFNEGSFTLENFLSES